MKRQLYRPSIGNENPSPGGHRMDETSEVDTTDPDESPSGRLQELADFVAGIVDPTFAQTTNNPPTAATIATMAEVGRMPRPLFVAVVATWIVAPVLQLTMYLYMVAFSDTFTLPEWAWRANWLVMGAMVAVATGFCLWDSEMATVKRKLLVSLVCGGVATGFLLPFIDPVL